MKRKVGVRNVGEGRTNPELHHPCMLLLDDYLRNGYDYMEPNGVDFQHLKGEIEAEEKFKEIYETGI